MTDERTRARQDGRRQRALEGQRAVANGVDAAMHDVQSPGAHAGVDRFRREAERQELPARDGAVLPSGESRQPPVWWAVLTLYMGVNTAHHAQRRRARPKLAPYFSLNALMRSA
jgi:hypothetical protein